MQNAPEYELSTSSASVITALPVSTSISVPTPSPEVPTKIPAPTGKLIDQGQDIVGVWQIDYPDWETAYMIIRGDGTNTFSPHPMGADRLNQGNTGLKARYSIS